MSITYKKFNNMHYKTVVFLCRYIYLFAYYILTLYCCIIYRLKNISIPIWYINMFTINYYLLTTKPNLNYDNYFWLINRSSN